jgi:HlyD family secretion protein
MPNDAPPPPNGSTAAEIAGARIDPAEDVRRTLGLDRKRGPLRKLLPWLAGLIVIAGAVVAFSAWRRHVAAENQPTYKTEPVHTGNLTVTVSATGTLKGLDTVDVGAEISGRVTEVDVDFNDHVKQGQLLAKINPEQYQAQVKQSRAELAAAVAALVTAKATRTQSKIADDRQHTLFSKGLAAQQDVDSADADYARAVAGVNSAAANVEAQRANLAVAESNLAKCDVHAPIAGIVLNRAIDPGQTVAASLSAPVLFTLAKDLTQMRLYVDIDEADVGGVTPGDKATFTVDAYPGKTFPSKVLAVYNAPTAAAASTQATVVTYEGVLEVANDDMLLRPGMTATATIVTRERNDVVLVPNTALRFVPPKVALAAEEQHNHMHFPGLHFGGGHGPPRAKPANTAKKPEAPGARTEHVWLLVNGAPKQRRVKVGATNGDETEVLSGLHAGAQVITDVVTKKK